LYRVEEVAEMLGLGRTKTYQLVASGELPSVRLGRCLRVPAHAIRRWIEEQTESQRWPAPTRRAG
jgi:excisionase family DNA binding protein